MLPLEEEHSSSDCEFLDVMHKNISYRWEWMLFNNVTMEKPASMRILKNYPLARKRFMRMRQPPPLQTSLHTASSCSSTPEAKRRRGHVEGDTEERTTKRTRSCHVHDWDDWKIIHRCPYFSTEFFWVLSEFFWVWKKSILFFWEREQLDNMAWGICPNCASCEFSQNPWRCTFADVRHKSRHP